MEERIRQIAFGLSEASGAIVQTQFRRGTDAVVNDPDVTRTCVRAAGEVVGLANLDEIPLPSMGGEDFSGYLKLAPGCLLRLGVAASDAPGHFLHSPHFDIDERALVIGAKVLAHSVVLLSEHGREQAIVSLYKFVSNPSPTLGVEIELNLVDARSMALRSGVFPILESLPSELHGSVKPELFQCYLEINTGVCKDVDEVERDLTAKIKVVERAARNQGMRLFWGGTHPFSRWQDQEVTPDKRYLDLVDLLQETPGDW